MGAVTAAEFEQLIREQLLERDKRRRARLLDPLVYREADDSCVQAIMRAAGFEVPDDTKKAVRRRGRTAAANQAAAFGDDAAIGRTT